MTIALLTCYMEEKDSVRINNGFSFVRHLLGEDVIDLFVDIKNFKRQENQVVFDTLTLPYIEKVYCTFSYVNEFIFLRRYIDHRWVIGGPLAEAYSEEIKKMVPDAEVCAFPMEYMLKKQLSSTFTDYWHKNNLFNNQIKKAVWYNCSLGRGCTWKKCRFCDYPDVETTCYYRKDIQEIFSGLVENPNGTGIVHLCASDTPPRQLREIIKHRHITADKGIYSITVFTRASISRIKAIKEADDLTGLTFTIGMEAFSQKAIDLLNKGFKISEVLSLTEEIIKRNGNVILSIMDNYVFMDTDILRESIKTVKILSQYHQFNTNEPIDVKTRKNGYLMIFNSGNTLWPHRSLSFIDQYSPSIQKAAHSFNNLQFGYGYFAYPKAGSVGEKASYALNNFINSHLIVSGLPLFRR